MQIMLRTLTQNWTIFRALRLILGAAILVQGIQAGDAIFALAGGLFTLMALLNAGCCAGGACTSPQTRQPDQTHQPISYEEVDNKK